MQNFLQLQQLIQQCALAPVLLETGAEFPAVPTVDPTMVRVYLNKRRLHALVPLSKENKQCTVQHMHITVVEPVHSYRWLLADLV